ncbi:MAG: hypothetical protein GY949_20820 [Gammaproteobacteria bacterium]|nr:hypothetical protein [Gammaproteobacteria bacterium]
MYRFVFLLVLFLGTGHASPLFEDDAVLEVSLTGPLSSVTNDTAERRERDFTLNVDGVDLDVSVRMRGNSRALKCSFPPLRLNFSSSHTDGSIFSGQKKLKLVTHCKYPDDYEANVLEEYAAYRIYSLLTDLSFRTRLLRIRYVDSDDPGRKPLLRFAFLIESENALATRLGGELIAVPHLTRNMLDARHSALGYVFQYLIANTDWSQVRFIDDDICCHNGKLIKVAEGYYLVPYDFDMSGLVNARYAKPHPDLRLRSVRTRRYRGYCTTEEVLRDALRIVSARREEIMRIVAELPASSAKDARSRSSFLQRFFKAASNEDKLLRKFDNRCL